MRRIAVLLAAAALMGCAESEEPIQAPRVSSNGEIPGEFYRVEIDGKPCIVWMNLIDQGSNYADSQSGITCDWGPQ